MQFYSLLLSVIRSVKGGLQRIWWLRVYYLKASLSLFSAYLVFSVVSLDGEGVLDKLASPQNFGYMTEALAVIILLISGIKWWTLVHTEMVFEKLAFIQQLPNSVDTYDQISRYGEHAIIYNAEVNLAVNQANNPIRLNPKLYQLHPFVNDMLPYFVVNMPEARIDTSDDLKVRLSSDLDLTLIASNAPVNLQKTSYFRDRLSNSLGNYTVRRDGRLIFDLRSNEVLTHEGYFFSLRESKLSNQLGGSVLLVTSDAALVMLKQGNRSAENAGKLAPSGSGSFDYVRPKQLAGMSFQDYARQQVCRELVEETGLKQADIQAIHICGFGRYLYRNGKPELFFIATTHASSGEISIPVREWDYHQKTLEVLSFDGGLSRAGVVGGLEKLISNIENKSAGYQSCSGVVYWNALFARDYVAQVDEATLKTLLQQPTH